MHYLFQGNESGKAFQSAKSWLTPLSYMCHSANSQYPVARLIRTLRVGCIQQMRINSESTAVRRLGDGCALEIMGNRWSTRENHARGIQPRRCPLAPPCKPTSRPTGRGG